MIQQAHSHFLVSGSDIEFSKGQFAATPFSLSPTVDTYVADDAADTAYNTANTLRLRKTATPAYKNGLMLFDLSSLAGKTITNPILTLTCGSVATTVATIGVHAILAANSGWIAACTWNFADGAAGLDRWAGDAGGDGGADAGCNVAGTDYNAVAMGSWTMNASDPIGTVYTIALNVVQLTAMVAANYGLALIRQTTTNIEKQICSQEHPTAAYRPVLSGFYS